LDFSSTSTVIPDSPTQVVFEEPFFCFFSEGPKLQPKSGTRPITLTSTTTRDLSYEFASISNERVRQNGNKLEEQHSTSRKRVREAISVEDSELGSSASATGLFISPFIKTGRLSLPVVVDLTDEDKEPHTDNNTTVQAPENLETQEDQSQSLSFHDDLEEVTPASKKARTDFLFSDLFLKPGSTTRTVQQDDESEFELDFSSTSTVIPDSPPRPKDKRLISPYFSVMSPPKSPPWKSLSKKTVRRSGSNT